MISARRKQPFKYVASGEQREDPAARWLRNMVQGEFGLERDKMRDIFDEPGSRYRILTYNRDRGDRLSKIAVLAVAAFSETAIPIQYVANRSMRNTNHVREFFDQLEKDAFSTEERQTVSVEATGIKNIQRVFFEARGYAQELGAYTLHTESYHRRINATNLLP